MMSKAKRAETVKRDRIAAAREKLARGDIKPAEVLAKEKKEDARKAKEKKQAKLVEALKRENVELEEKATFFEALKGTTIPEIHPIKKLRGQGLTLPVATYFMLMSDIHAGKEIKPHLVGFKNELTPEIAEARCDQFWKSQLIMLQAARAAFDVRVGVLWLGGDLMENYLREENLETNTLSPNEEGVLLLRILISGIHSLLARSDFEKLYILTSNGNHSRMNPGRIRVASEAKNSYEWGLYQYLRMWFDEQERLGQVDKGRIVWQIEEGLHNVLPVYGYRVSFHHGSSIRYQGGVGGVMTPAIRKITRQAASIPVRYEGTEQGVPHLYVHAHYHHRLFPKYFIQNGSICGWDSFAEWTGMGFEDPSQLSFVIDEKYKEVSNYNWINVTPSKRSRVAARRGKAARR